MLYIKLPHAVALQIGEVAVKERCASLLAVYVALLIHSNQKGECFPSYERIKEVSGIRSRSSVSKALFLLEHYGFIKKRSRHGMHGNNAYQIPKVPSSSQVETTRPSAKSTHWTAKVHSVDSPSPINGPLKSNHWTAKVHLMDRQSPFNGLEVYSFNYNHLSKCNLTKEEKTTHSLKEDLTSEEKLRELFQSLAGRALIPPEEVLLAKLLYNLPRDKVFALIEEAYLKNPNEFARKGLFLIPHWEEYQYA